MKSLQNEETDLPIKFSAFDIRLSESTKREEIITWLNDLKQQNKNIFSIQSFRKDAILSQAHLFSAIYHSWNGYKNNLMISNSLSVEFLLYLSGQRQISKAMKYFGLNNKVQEFSLVVFHFNELERDFISKSKEFNKKLQTLDNLTVIETFEKKKQIAKLFEYTYTEDDAALKSEKGLQILENFILTSISNVVFESTNNINKNK